MASFSSGNRSARNAAIAHAFDVVFAEQCTYGLKVNAGELFVGFTFDVIRWLKLR